MADLASKAQSAAGTHGTFSRLRERHIAWLRNSGMSGLLVLLAFGMFVLPALESLEPHWRFWSDILLTLLLASGVVAVLEHRRLAVALAALSVVVVAARWAEWIIPSPIRPMLREASTLAAVTVLATAVGLNVFASSRALGNRIFGAIVLYLLLGLIWAVIYAILDATVPDAFAGHSPSDATLFGWGYFSLVTLTTVGYGDITPVARAARSLATLEALVGQLYPAIIIARLVSLQDPAR